jgi:LCP family protein required for cell wall assembly
MENTSPHRASAPVPASSLAPPGITGIPAADHDDPSTADREGAEGAPRTGMLDKLGTTTPDQRPKRRWRKVLILISVSVLVLAAGGIVAGWAYTRSLDKNVKRVDAFAGLPTDRPVQVVTKAMNMLLLGSDSRDPDSTAASRTDTIMLVHVDADHKHGYAISIPRDTWVFVPKSADGKNGNTMAKINAAYAWGGPSLTIQTVEKFTGVRIDHLVMIDFAGFKDVVDALGGVDMQVEKTITSIHPPFRKFTAGENHFNGAEALDYVRQRKQFPDGDFTRAKHQQAFLKDLLTKAASTGTLTDPLKLNNFLQAVSKSVTVDKSFDLISTALDLRNMRGSDVTFLTNPSAGTGTIDGQSVVRPDPAKDKALYDAVAHDKVAAWKSAND